MVMVIIINNDDNVDQIINIYNIENVQSFSYYIILIVVIYELIIIHFKSLRIILLYNRINNYGGVVDHIF